MSGIKVSVLCTCGQDNQTAEHNPPSVSKLQQTVWTMETPLQVKLYGPQLELERTARFVLNTGLTDQQANDTKKKKKKKKKKKVVS